MKEKKKSPWRFAYLAMALWGMAELLGNGIAWLIGSTQHRSHGAASIGIIGGADGPTAIFLSHSQPTMLQILLCAAMVAVGTWGYGYLRGKK